MRNETRNHTRWGPADSHLHDIDLVRKPVADQPRASEDQAGLDRIRTALLNNVAQKRQLFRTKVNRFSQRIFRWNNIGRSASHSSEEGLPSVTTNA